MINITARAYIVNNKRELLLVTNDETYWYLPGGHLKQGESLKKAAEREVYEETGISITCQDIIYCSEFYDNIIDSHKVEIIFLSRITEISSETPWTDLDGPVKQAKFFDAKALKNINVLPQYLKSSAWLEEMKSPLNIYQGYESNERN